MKIAVVGTGISGLLVAYLLHPEHELTVYEANDYIGGHSHTHDLSLKGQSHQVDSGFIVYNERTYPNFVRLLKHLKVPTQASPMSFGISCARTGLEYSSDSLNTLFAQRKNLVSPYFWRLLYGILRFNRNARKVIQEERFQQMTLGDYIQEQGLERAFCEHYLLPMGGAIWSTTPKQLQDFPIRYFVKFFENHGLLTLTDQPQWRTIRGGSKNYVAALSKSFAHRILLKTPVTSVRREEGGVELMAKGRAPERFDQIVFATHSDITLRLLADPSDAEREILGAIPYRLNEAILHTDEELLPKNPKARAAWNYLLNPETHTQVTLTYNMNRLQSIPSSQSICVTLNRGESITAKHILERMNYEHPQFSSRGFAVQGLHHKISGQRRTHFCGAYWGWGFHEDGVNSALRVAGHFGRSLP